MQHFSPCDKLIFQALEKGPGIPAAQAQAQAPDIFLELLYLTLKKNNINQLLTNKKERITMQEMTIKNMKDDENYIKSFNTVDDAKQWVINHLDLSKDWKVIITKPKNFTNTFFDGLINYGLKHMHIEGTKDGLKFKE